MGFGQCYKVSVSGIGVAADGWQSGSRERGRNEASVLPAGNADQGRLRIQKGCPVAGAHANNAEETKFRDRVSNKLLLLLQPGASGSVFLVRTPSAGEQKIYVEQATHGKSARIA